MGPFSIRGQYTSLEPERMGCPRFLPLAYNEDAR
jgi:hypothetical protein